MKLNIYDKKKVTKTYEAEEYFLMFSTVEDTIKLFNVEQLKTGSNDEITKLVLTTLPKCIGSVKPLLKDIFDGLTDEEIRNTRIVDIAMVFVNVVKHAYSQVMDYNTYSKN